jgi:concentrative nucleoside transporter, CNT family
MATEKHLVHNPDLALHESREHAHEHLHHSAAAEKGRTDNVHYTKGTTDEPSIVPKPDANDDYLHRHKEAEAARSSSSAGGKDGIKYDEKDFSKYDAEKGDIVSKTHTQDADEADPQRHRVSRFYRKYRIFFHLALAALFTG